MTVTVKERDARFMADIKTATRAMRETLFERAMDLAREFRLTREALQDQIVRERRNQGHPDKASRGIYVPIGLTARIVDKSVQLAWCRFHFNRRRELVRRYIPKGPGTKYSIPAITQGVPYWIKNEIRHMEQRAALIRKQQVLIAAVEIAMRAAARGLATLDRDEDLRTPGSATGWLPAANDIDAPPDAGSAAARIAPTPRSEEEW